MELEQEPTCNVCFVRPLKLYDYSEIVTCVQCHMTSHKSCYNPALAQNTFICDLCASGEKGPTLCYLCGNSGLMKKVDDFFAHPICLLFSPLAIATQYKTLQFSIIGQQSRKDKKAKCSVCKNPGNFEKCFSGCNQQAHIYCIWSEYHKAQTSSDSKGWNHNPVVKQLNYEFFFDKKAKEFLAISKPELLHYFKPVSKHKIKLRQFEIVCPDHTEDMFECCMSNKYFDRNQLDHPIEYAQCNQCLKWYHQECLDQESLKVALKEDTFVCKPCQNFHKMLKRASNTSESSLQIEEEGSERVLNEIFLEEIPRLNICELIYLQYLYEKKNYQLTSKESELMFRLPIEPSVLLLQTNLRRNILSQLKVQDFKDLIHFQLNNRIQKKQFKDKFSQKLEKILKFLVGQNGLLEVASDHRKSQEGDIDKSKQMLHEEEKQKFTEWSQLLRQFKEKYSEYEKIVAKLIQKLKDWLDNYSEKQVKEWESSDEIDNERQGEKICEQSAEVTEKEKLNEPFVKSLELEDMISNEGEENRVLNKIEEQNLGYQTKKVSHTYKTRNQSQSENESSSSYPIEDPDHKSGSKIPYMSENLSKSITDCINFTKNASIHQRHVDQACNELKTPNKTFNLDIILSTKLSTQSTLRLLSLEALFQNFLKILDNSKQILDESQKNVSNSEILLTKDLIQQKYRKTIKLIELYFKEIQKNYDESSSQVKKLFYTKISSLILSVTDLTTKFKTEISKLQNKLNVHEALNIYEKNPAEKQQILTTIKQQVKSTPDENDLVSIRIQMQKIQVYKKIKKIRFDNESRLKILQEYDDHCKSSSQTPLKQSFEIKTAKLIVRKEIMAIQEESLNFWLQMYGAIYQLSNDFLSQETTSLIGDSWENLDEGSVDLKEKEPLQVISKVLNSDLQTKSEDYKNKIFDFSLNFFSKLTKKKLNYKIFHEDLVQTVEILAQFCIVNSFENIHAWGAKDEQIRSVRNIYRKFQNLNFLKENLSVNEQFCRMCEIFEVDQAFEEYLQDNQKNLFDDPALTEHIFVEKIPEMKNLYNEIGFSIRLKQIKTISLWISIYFKILKQVGFQAFFGDSYDDFQLRKKYEGSLKPTFGKLTELSSFVAKSSFPNSSQFIKRFTNLYNEAENIEIHVDQFFAKSSKFFELSRELKTRFMKTKNIEKDCFDFNDDMIKEEKINVEDFEKLIEILSNNPLLDTFTWEIQKHEIQNKRIDFLILTQKIEAILMKSDTKTCIKDMNNMFFDVISYPFQYENLSLFYLYIRQRVERSTILSLQEKKSFKNKKEKIDDIELAYRNILESLEPKQKSHFQTRITKDQIMANFTVVENNPDFTEILLHPVLKKMRHTILAHIENFDSIKESCEVIEQKINENKVLTLKEIQSLGQVLSSYKKQRIFELGLEVLYREVENYNLIFTPIPNSRLDMQVVLQQFKSLKTSFRTAEMNRRIKELEKKIQGLPFE